MANSTTNIDGIVQSQASKEITANAFFDAASPATLGGRRQSTCSGLTWGFYGGYIFINGSPSFISNGTLTLAASVSNYIELNPTTGVITANATGFTAGRIPLYVAVTGAATVSTYTDYRLPTIQPFGILAKAMSDANQTLTQPEAMNNVLGLTGTLTAARNIVLPLTPKQYTVHNGTTGGFGLQFIGASGTGITVAAGKRAILYADGTNIVRVTADT